MRLSLSTPQSYSIPQKALRRWAREHLRRQPCADGRTVYSFAFSGSTCNNMGKPLQVVMEVTVDAAGTIVAASSQPALGDTGCDAMCATDCNAGQFFSEVGGCDEAVGLTVRQAAFRDWRDEPSGCFCTPGNRRHKWRNVFQTLHYAATHLDA